MNSSYFNQFRTGTLFLIRTPDTFPVGYAERSIADMAGNLHLDYAAWLETWNCLDGIVWPHKGFPRSSYWKNEPRDPLEEVFQACDKHGMAFLPEAGVMHKDFMLANSEDMHHGYDHEGKLVNSRYGRIGTVPAAPITAEYFIAKYDALLDQYGHHPSCKGICMPCENGIGLTYDRHTQALWKKAFSCEMPKPKEIFASRTLIKQVYHFLEDCFLQFYRTLARHLKQKYNLPLMHYPISKVSDISHMQEPWMNPVPARNLSVMAKVEELDLLNLQLHPPLSDNIYHFKLEIELLQGLAKELPNVADTHFYHESCSGKLPPSTPKRYTDYVLSTITPYGVSFFCYGFFAPELPLWKKMLNPGAPVYKAYATPEIVARRREGTKLGLDLVEQLRDVMQGTFHKADCAIYWNEDIDFDYLYNSYYRDHLFGLYELCQAAALPTCIVTDIPRDTAQTKVLILAGIKSLAEQNYANLEAYIQAGGKVIVIGDCNKKIFQICGLDVQLTDAEFLANPTGGKHANWWVTPPDESKKYTELNGECLYPYDTGKPAVTQVGNIVFFGTASSIWAYSDRRSVNLVKLWSKLLHDLDGFSGISTKAPYRGLPNAHLYLSADTYKTPDGKKIVLLLRNFGVELIGASVTWNLPEKLKVTKAFADGKQFDFQQDQPMPEFEHLVFLVAEQVD